MQTAAANDGSWRRNGAPANGATTYRGHLPRLPTWFCGRPIIIPRSRCRSVAPLRCLQASFAAAVCSRRLAALFPSVVCRRRLQAPFIAIREKRSGLIRPLLF
jgi:hypothetical protein